MREPIALTALLLSTAFLVLSLQGPREATEKETPGPPVQVLTLGKPEKHDPLHEQEAQVMPWANKLEGVTVTYYCCCVECCGKSDGITYSGTKVAPYETCAVDPDVIPLGSDVAVDYGDGELRHYRAEDIGGGVNGNQIDICVSSHEEALEPGRRTATVYWMEVSDEGTR